MSRIFLLFFCKNLLQYEHKKFRNKKCIVRIIFLTQIENVLFATSNLDSLKITLNHPAHISLFWTMFQHSLCPCLLEACNLYI